MVESIAPERPEYLLLEPVENGFRLVRVNDDESRSEFYLTGADIVCLHFKIRDIVNHSITKVTAG